MKILSVVVVLLVSSITVLHGQKYHQGEVSFTDGSVKKGLVKPPTSPSDRKIAFKAGEDSPVEKFNSSLLQEVIVYVDDLEHRFVRREVRKPKVKEPTADADYKYLDAIWLAEMVTGAASLYAAGPMMKIKKDGRLRVELNWNGHGAPPDIMFYGTKNKDKTPTWMAFYSVATMGQMKAFKYWATRFFSDYPALVARIEAGEFKVAEIADVFEEYNRWKR